MLTTYVGERCILCDVDGSQIRRSAGITVALHFPDAVNSRNTRLPAHVVRSLVILRAEFDRTVDSANERHGAANHSGKCSGSTIAVGPTRIEDVAQGKSPLSF